MSTIFEILIFVFLSFLIGNLICSYFSLFFTPGGALGKVKNVFVLVLKRPSADAAARFFIKIGFLTKSGF